MCIRDSGGLQPLDGDGVLGPDVDVALVGPHGVARDGHGLQNGMGVALQHRAVHERAGIALVGVAADVLHPVGAHRVGGELPLFARGEARAAPAPQAGGQHLSLIHICGGQPIQHANVRNFTDIKALRAAALYRQDEGMTYRRSHENPVVQKVYADFLGEPGSHKAHADVYKRQV